MPSRSLSCLKAVVHQSITSYFLPIYYSTLVYYQIYTLFFALTFLESFSYSCYFGVSLCMITLGYYCIDYFWVLLLTQCFASKHIRSKLYKIFILNFPSFSVILYCFLAYTPCLRKKEIPAAWPTCLFR